MVAAAFAVLVITAGFAVLMVTAALAILVTAARLAVLVTTARLTILVTAAGFAILVVAARLAILVTAARFASSVIAATLTVTMVTATLAVAVAATSAAATALLGTAAGRQFGASSGIRLHVVGIVAQLADLLTQLVGIGSGRIIRDGQLGGLHVVRVVLDSLEIGHVLFELVCTFLTDAIGLDRDGLLLLGGRFALLGIRAQRDDGC